jgi:O-antigen/teichoic acid export membrane protein
MSGLRALLGKAGHYFAGNGLGVLSGLISYPLLTRLLDPAQYGLMGLVSSTLLFSVAMGKIGIGSAGVRFYTQATREDSLDRLISTYLSMGLGLGAAAALLQAGAALGLDALGALEHELCVLLVLTSPTVLSRVEATVGLGFLRAAERSQAYNVLDVSGRYLSLGLSLAGVLLGWGLIGFFGGLVLAEALLAALIAWQTRKLAPWRFGRPDHDLARQALAYGAPLLAFELTNIVLAFGDRAILKMMVSEAELGHYTAAYNLGNTLQSLLLTPIAMSIQPAYMKVWTDEGEEATRNFLEKAWSLFLLLALPSLVGVAAVSEPLVLLLAGEEYRDGVAVLPLTFGGYLLYGGYAILGAGLYVRSQTKTIPLAAGAAVLLNVALNFALIPSMGIEGAALATAIAYAVLLVALGALGRRALAFPLSWAYAAKLAAMSAVMGASIWWIELGSPLWTLAARVTVGAVVILSLALGLDRRGRALVREVFFARRG